MYFTLFFFIVQCSNKPGKESPWTQLIIWQKTYSNIWDTQRSLLGIFPEYKKIILQSWTSPHTEPLVWRNPSINYLHVMRHFENKKRSTTSYSKPVEKVTASLLWSKFFSRTKTNSTKRKTPLTQQNFSVAIIRPIQLTQLSLNRWRVNVHLNTTWAMLCILYYK